MYTTDYAYDGPIFLVPLSLSYPSSPVYIYLPYGNKNLLSACYFSDQYELTLTVAALVTMMSSMIVAHEGYLAKKRSSTRGRFDIPLPVLHLIPTLIALTIIYIYDIGTCWLYLCWSSDIYWFSCRSNC